MVEDEVARMLDLLNAGWPALERMTGPEARVVVAARAQPVDNIDDVRSAEDAVVETAEENFRVRIYRPHGEPAAPLPVVLFFHGGGFVFCSIESHDGFCRRLARHTEAVVVSVDYRLAPEHRAPAAADDAYAALTWLDQNADELGVDPRRIVTVGDSAGGNLAAVVCLMARERGGPQPIGQVLIYPVIEPDFSTPSYQRYATGYFNTSAAMKWYWQQYLGENGNLPGPAWQVTPLHADSLSGLPAAIIITAGRDPLCSEGQSYATALRDAGVQVRHRHYPELFHGFLTMADFGPGISARDLLWSDLAHLMARAPERTST